jgi:isocitrate dehydrogenase kinase/phosphatase
MQTGTMDDSQVDNARRVLLIGFDDYLDAFATITQRAWHRFERRDWHGMRLDTVERLDLYQKVVDETQSQRIQCLKNRLHQRAVWEKLKHHITDFGLNR